MVTCRRYTVVWHVPIHSNMYIVCVMFCIVMYCFTCDTVLCNISVAVSKCSPFYHLSMPPGASLTWTPTQPQRYIAMHVFTFYEVPTNLQLVSLHSLSIFLFIFSVSCFTSFTLFPSMPPGASQAWTPTQPQSALGPCPLRKWRHCHTLVDQTMSMHSLKMR